MLAAARDGRLTSQALQGRAPVLTAGRLRNAGYLTRDESPQLTMINRRETRGPDQPKGTS